MAVLIYLIYSKHRDGSVRVNLKKKEGSDPWY